MKFFFSSFPLPSSFPSLLPPSLPPSLPPFLPSFLPSFFLSFFPSFSLVHFFLSFLPYLSFNFLFSFLLSSFFPFFFPPVPLSFLPSFSLVLPSFHSLRFLVFCPFSKTGLPVVLPIIPWYIKYGGQIKDGRRWSRYGKKNFLLLPFYTT